MVSWNDDFDGKMVIVTGAGKGLGRAIALELGRLGASVVCAARTPARVDAVVSRIRDEGGKALGVYCDVSQPEDADRMAMAAVSEFGQIDMLVNNAGIQGKIEWAWKLEPDEWERIMATNLKSVYLCCKAVLPGMIEREQGKIVNVASGVMEERVDLGVACYYASKAAVVIYTRNLAGEVKRYGIHVNAIDPAGMDTAMSDEIIAHEASTDEFAFSQTNAGRGPRLRPPEAIVPMVLFLLSSQSNMMTGRLLQASAPDDVQYLQL